MKKENKTEIFADYDAFLDREDKSVKRRVSLICGMQT